MIPQDKMEELAKDLLAKSQKNEVVWQRLPRTDEFVFGDDIFFVNIPPSRIYTTFASPDSKADWAAIQVYVGNEKIGDLTSEDGFELFEVLKSLNAEAYRALTKWDEVYKNIVDRLEADETVGEEPDEYLF